MLSFLVFTEDCFCGRQWATVGKDGQSQKSNKEEWLRWWRLNSESLLFFLSFFNIWWGIPRLIMEGERPCTIVLAKWETLAGVGMTRIERRGPWGKIRLESFWEDVLVVDVWICVWVSAKVRGRVGEFRCLNLNGFVPEAYFFVSIPQWAGGNEIR